ncbi:MAG: hypothetical protein OXI69_11430 [Acidobacteriota bacterium]|nr:hypothetical protein [Acidobacteriota bacterium]
MNRQREVGQEKGILASQANRDEDPWHHQESQDMRQSYFRPGLWSEQVIMKKLSEEVAGE